MTRPRRGTVGAVGVLLALALTACTAEQAEEAPSTTGGAPAAADGVAVVGDSISLGFNACGVPGPCPEVSWATGDSPEVESVASRLAQVEGTDPERVVAARAGGTVSDAVRATGSVVDGDVGVVLVLVGANDVCRPSAAEVTPPETFGASYRELLGGLRDGLPDARIVTLSVPDLLRLWELGRTDARIAQAWEQSPSCRSILGDARSDAPAAVERRAAMDAVVDAYNDEIEAACAETAGCVSDQQALHDVGFEVEDVSTLDRFHPSVAGQRKIAAVAWPLVEPAA